MRFSCPPLLDDFEWCVVDAPCLGIDRDTGNSVESRLLPRSRACYVHPEWAGRSPRMEVSRLDREEAVNWALVPHTLSTAQDRRDDPCYPAGSRWREPVEVAVLDIELHSRLLSLGRPEDDAGWRWSQLWRRGERHHSDVCIGEPRSLE